MTKLHDMARDSDVANSSSEGVSRRDFLVRTGQVAGGLVAVSSLGTLAGALGAEDTVEAANIPGAPVIPRLSISFGIGPYVDHSYWIIGVRKGWFKEVGITLTPGPAGRSSLPDTWGPALISHTVDIQSASESHYLPSMKTARNLRQLLWTDLFQGFAVLVQPDEGLKSASQLIAQGQSASQAVYNAIRQLKGRKLLFAPEAGERSFVEAVLKKGGMSLKDVSYTEIQDANQVPLMVTHRADAQVSGVPIRLTLQEKGFKVLVSAADLVKTAKPSASSPELLTVFRDGAATTEQWYTAHQDAALRLTSVVFRITQLINTNPNQANAIQRPFVNSIAGTALSPKLVNVAYNALDPFYTYQKQRTWYEDPSSPFYYKYEFGAYIDSWVSKGLFKKGELTVDELALNAHIYKELETLQKQSASLINTTARRIHAKGGQHGNAAKLLQQARVYYSHFNFLDAWRFAKAASTKV